MRNRTIGVSTIPVPPVRRRLYALLLIVASASVCFLANAFAVEPKRDVQQAAESLAVREGYQFRAIASEPLVVDPVSARFDSRGRLWVVEMPDYPVGPVAGRQPGGRIKILTDFDNDGIFDQFDLFAEGLSFATGVQPYRDGAFVTLSGAIVFIRDRDGDNRGDETQVLFRGFTEQNQQLRANHPTLGPDGLVYVANGLRGGSVVAVDPRFKATEQPVDLRSKDFAFDPEGGWWGAVAGNSQFGLSIDDFGRRIGCSNRNPAMTPGLSLAEVERNPLLAARDAILDIAAAAEKSKVVSRAEAWTTSNLHSGQFSAACGVLAPGWSEAGRDSVLVCEPTAYIVQRQEIERDGSVWRAKRDPQRDEFFSSTDTWFRPVDLTAGPASSFLIVDMARAVIEHPDFMPPELKSRPDQRDGDDLGRIWQVARDGRWPTIKSLDGVGQALRWLQSDSPWQRQAASQFLLESDQDQNAALGSIVMSASAPAHGRARAAWILHRQHELTIEQVQSLTHAMDPRLRGLAISLSGDHPDSLLEVLTLSEDNDPLVRRAVAARAGIGTTFAAERAAALSMIATGSSTDDWIERTVASIDRQLVDAVAMMIVEQGSNPAGSTIR